MACGITLMAIDGTVPMRSVPTPPSRIDRAEARRLSSPRKERSTSRNRASASTVGVSRPAILANSLNPVSRSSCEITRLMFGCEVCSWVAAVVIEPVTITARKASICLKFIRAMVYQIRMCRPKQLI
jgi:hypothetical protein